MRTRLVVWVVLGMVGAVLWVATLTATFSPQVQHPRNPKLDSVTHPWQPLGPIPVAPPPF